MSNPNLNYLVQRAIYDLKRRYGNEITVYRRESASTNYETGQKSSTVSVYHIRHAVVLPASEMRKFFASLAFISAAKQFLAPGNTGWDESKRGFIIEARDIPGFEFQPEDWIVYKHKRYEVELIEELETSTGWLIVGKQLLGAETDEVISINANNTISFSEEINES